MIETGLMTLMTVMPADARHPSTVRAAAQRGAAYIVALLVIVVLAAVALVFAREMRVEAYASTNHASQAEARWIARGAIEAIRGEIAADLDAGQVPRLDTTGDQAVALGGGMYWVIRPSHDDDRERAFGLTSEAGKLDVNTTSAEVLADLPGITPAIAAAIVDWRDPDGELTPGGAESQYYQTRTPSYRAKNQPFETAGELMLVRGITRELFFGEDTNRNGILDINENDGSATAPDDNRDGNLDFGLIDYLTVHGVQPNTRADGEDRLNLNQGGGQNTQQIRAYLQEVLGEERGDEVANTLSSGRPYENTLDFFVKAEMTPDEFDLIHDGLTTDGDDVISRVDVYHAPEAVLDALSGLERGDGRAIIAARPEVLATQAPPSLAWLVSAIGEEKAVEAASMLTTRSNVYTADIVAVSGDGRAFVRWTVVLDTTRFELGAALSPVFSSNGPANGGESAGQTSGGGGTSGGGLPRVLSLVDRSAMGWPLEREVLEALRGGETIEAVSSAYGGSTR